MQPHILSIILFTPLLGALVLLFVPKENKDAVRWIANFFALAGLLVSLPLVPGSGSSASSPASSSSRARPATGSLDRRGLRPGHRRHFVPADHAHHASGMDLDPLLLDRHRESRQGILHLVSGSPDRHARRLHGAGFLPLLRVLGSHAGPHVLADRDLGRPAQTLRRHQVFPLYIGRLGADAAGHSVSLLPSSTCDRSLHV